MSYIGGITRVARKHIDIITGRWGAIATIPQGAEWIGKETLAVDSTVRRFNPKKYANADIAHIDVQVAAIRYYLDGSNPSTTSGHIAYPGDIIDLENRKEIEDFAAIEDTATDAVLEVSFGRN